MELDSVYDAYQAACGNEYCYDLFHIPTPDSDNFLLAIDSGGSAGIRYLRLAERVNHEFVTISEFEAHNAGYGRVIQYEGEFYYIFLQNNYSLKIYDGVRVYKLGENMEYENLQIQHLPYAYVWKNLYNTPEGGKWDHYIESIQGEIDSNEYLIDGTNEDECGVYFGDEEEMTEPFIVPENEKIYAGNKYHKIDFANVGVPIYIRKSNFYEWEWMGALETMGASSIDYQEEYLREEVAFISLTFFHNVGYDNNDVNIGIMMNLSESDQVRMKVDINYDCKKKELRGS